MVKAGDDAAHARAMYDESVTAVVVAAVVLAAIASIGLAILLGADARAAARRRSARPPAGSPRATTPPRVPRDGPEELASLADSFNQMAASLERQEAMRRDFIANAAHELRTPLTNLQGYLEALRDGVIVADRATYDSLWEEAERLVRLSRSLDALAEGDAASGPPELVELDLAASIRMALDLAQPSLERAGLTVVVDLPDRLPARANPDQLAQVLANLLSNAVRYTPAGGTVTVRAERRPGDCLVSIVNTGEGIPPEDLDRVFERFYRVEKSRDRARGGAGHRARDREAARRGRRRPGRRGVRGRPDAVLVQPAGLTGRRRPAAAPTRAGRSRSSRRRSPARPTHWSAREPLTQERHGDDDRHRRPEGRRETDHPRRRRLEADGERDEPERRRGRRRR